MSVIDKFNCPNMTAKICFKQVQNILRNFVQNQLKKKSRLLFQANGTKYLA